MKNKILENFLAIVSGLDKTKSFQLAYSTTLLKERKNNVLKFVFTLKEHYSILKREPITISETIRTIELADNFYILETEKIYYFTVITTVSNPNDINFVLCSKCPVQNTRMLCHKIFFTKDNFEAIGFQLPPSEKVWVLNDGFAVTKTKKEERTLKEEKLYFCLFL